MKGTHFAFLILFGLFAFSSFSAFAEEPEEDEEAMDEEAMDMGDDEIWEQDLGEILDIKVSVASSFEETDMESGSTVALVNEKKWRKYGANTLGEAIDHLPGTFVMPTAYGGTAVAIRGYATNLSVRGIATVLDGVPLNSQVLGTGLYSVRALMPQSLARIEMIRGPGSALYGSDAFHGVLSAKTYEGQEDAASVAGRVSDDGLATLSTTVTRQFGDNHRIDLIAATTDQADRDIPYQYTPPTPGSTLQSSSRTEAITADNLVVKMRNQFGDAITSQMGLYRMNQESEGSMGGGRALTGFSNFLDRDLTDSKTQRQIFNHRLSWDLENTLVFESKIYYWQSEAEFYTDFVNVPGFGFVNYELTEEKTLGVDLLIKQSENDFNTQWALGLGFKDSEISGRNLAALDPNYNVVQDTTAFDTLNNFSRDILSLTLEARTKLNDDKFHILYGGRYDEYSDFGNQLSPRVGLVYQFESQAIKLLYGEAFRAPVATEIRGNPNFRGNADLKPEVIETLELVYMLKGDQWKFSVTAFTSDWTDGIVLQPLAVPAPPITSEYLNAGSNESQGVEISFSGGKDQYSWDLSATYAESEGSVSSAGVPDFIYDYSAFPKYIINLDFGYELPEKNMSFYVTNRIHMDATEGPVTFQITEPVAIDDYYNTTLAFQWQASDSLSFDAAITDVFDQEKPYPSAWNAEFGAQNPDRGRRVQAGFHYAF